MSDDENVSVYNAPILMSYLINVSFKDTKNAEAMGDFFNMMGEFEEEFKGLFRDFLPKALKKLKVTREERRSLGFGRVKII